MSRPWFPRALFIAGCFTIAGCGTDVSDDGSGGGSSGSQSVGAGADCDCGLDVYAPVCGVDGQPYSEACGSDCVPVKIACHSECPCSPCPVEAPTANSGCTDELLTCSYGESFLAECRPFFLCANGVWQASGGPGFTCPDDPPPCPSSAPVDAEACSTDGTRCGFADGTSCACTTCPGFGGPCNPLPAPQWECLPPPAAPCPANAPNAGVACSGVDAPCTYGGCGGVTAECLDGFWSWTPNACAE